MKDTKRSFWLNTAIVLILIVGATLYSMFGGNSGSSLDMREDGITLSGPGEFTVSVEFADVASIEFREEFDRGNCIDGGSEKSYSYGTWENEEFGTYTLHVLTKVEACIVMTETDGDIVVFNIESADTTKAFTENLTEHFQTMGYFAIQ